MHLVVVGATGYIGSVLVRALVAEGHQVTSIGGPFTTNAVADYHYREGLYTGLQQELRSVDGVIYAAGRVVPSTNVSSAEALKLDVQPLAELLESIARCGNRPAFVLVSSAGAVYGPAPEGAELTEDSRTEPQSVYGLVRLTMEELVTFAHRSRQLKASIVRLSNVYGPGQRVSGPAAFVVRALTAARTGESMELWGGGQQRKDFLFVDDAVSGIRAGLRGAQTIEAPRAHVFNICRGTSDTLLTVLDTIRTVTGKAVPYKIVEARGTDVQRVELSARRAAEQLNWRAQVDLPTGLSRAWLGLGQPHH